MGIGQFAYHRGAHRQAVSYLQKLVNHGSSSPSLGLQGPTMSIHHKIQKIRSRVSECARATASCCRVYNLSVHPTR